MGRHAFASVLCTAAALGLVQGSPQLDGLLNGTPLSDLPSLLSGIIPSPTPTDLAQAVSALESIYAAAPTNVVDLATSVLQDGLAGELGLDQILAGYTCDSFDNDNQREPPQPVFPSVAGGDAPYDFSEADLRAAIYIPANFSYGADGKTPLIFIPGTGVTGCETYSPNYAKLVGAAAGADPVFLNVPNRMLDDEQNNAEFIAYAIHYISAVSASNVSIMAYSGGNTATQWALKYWPSTHAVVQDYLAISPDYKGTELDFELCLPGLPCPPSVLQQAYGSTFTRTLLANGGDSAYVPTTLSWSIFDENIFPQQGVNASAALQDAHGAGVTLNQIQDTCGALTLAGAPVPGHEGTLYNGEAFAVNIDALKNDGPGNIQRSGAADGCANLLAPGLGLIDLLGTEALQPIALLNVNLYPKKVGTEPPIKAYAQKDAPG